MAKRRRRARVIRASRPRKPAKKKKGPTKAEILTKAAERSKRQAAKRRAVPTSERKALGAGISSSIHVAKRDGVCEACGAPIPVGSAIRWNGYTRRPRHADCSLVNPDASIEQAKQEVASSSEPENQEVERQHLAVIGEDGDQVGCCTGKTAALAIRERNPEVSFVPTEIDDCRWCQREAGEDEG